MPTITLNAGVFDYGNLAAAVSAASANDTIHVTTVDMPGGGYVGSAAIDKSLTIVGTPDGSGNRPLLVAPTDTSATNGAVLDITGSGVTATISNLSITGIGDADDNFTFGIRVLDSATLNLSDSDVTGIASSPDSEYITDGTPGWTGIGIAVGGAVSVGTATLDNGSLTDYQDSGLIVQGAGSYASLSNSTVTGQGLLAEGQTGIYIVDGATATLTGNTITDHQYDGEFYNVGIYLNSPGVGSVITSNIISDNDAGIWHFAPAADSAANATLISGNTFTDNLIGIVLDTGTALVANNTITGGAYGIYAQAVDPATQDSVGYLTNNTISGTSVADTEMDDEAASADPVLNLNDAPVGTDDDETIDQFAPLSVPVATLFTDADDDSLTLSIATAAANGTASIAEDGSVLYIPNAGFIGTDSFTVGVSDGYGGTATATVTVTVQPIISLASTMSFGKAGDTATITVLLSAASSQDIDFTYATSDGVAVAGTDYTASTDTLTFTAGQTSKSFTIPLLTDAEATDGEAFGLTLSSPINASLAPSRTAESVVIFTPEPGDADATSDLNTTATAIDGLFEDFDDIRHVGDEDFGMDGTLANMTGYANSMKSSLTPTPPATVGSITSAWSSYSAQYDDLADEMDSLLDKAGEIILAADHAAQDSQGEAFRLLGVESFLRRLDNELACVSEELDYQKESLVYLRTLPGNTQSVAMGTIIGKFEELQFFIEAAQEECDLGTGYNTVPCGAPAVIATLNGYYGTLNDIYDNVHSNDDDIANDKKAMIDAAADEDWDTYGVKLTDLTEKVQDNLTLITTDTEERGPAAATVFYDAAHTSGVPGDDLATKGIYQYAADFDKFLSDEHADVVTLLEEAEGFDPGDEDSAIANLGSLPCDLYGAHLYLYSALD